MPVSQEGVHVRVDALRNFAARILTKVGMPAQDAIQVSDILVDTNQRGVDSHGIVRLIYYVNKLKQGGTNLKPTIRIVKESPVTAVVDGDHGMGQVVGTFSMNLAVQKAATSGVGIVMVRNSEHFGAAAYYARMAARQNLIGIACSNGPPVMVPWGGKNRAIGNNPLAIAAPGREEPALVLDMAMSKVAGGKVRLAAKKGGRIPDDWIVDKDGVPSDDPNDLPDGALLPLGHKGYGLAVMVEVLAGVLSGSGMLSEVPNWLFSPDRPTRTGHMMMALSIEHFMPMAEFLSRQDQLMSELRSCPPATTVESVLLPGEPEQSMAEERRKYLTLPQAVFDDLRTLEDEWGVEGLQSIPA